MRAVCISDTHSQHAKLTLPEGDLLIHAGDFTMMGEERRVKEFLDWFGAQPHQHKVFVAGNHDWLFERDSELARSLVPDNVHYLEDSGLLIKHGPRDYKLWGSPVQLAFGKWAFNRNQMDIDQHWQLIPEDTDILITHSPPLGILDKVLPVRQRRYEPSTSVGCWDLRRRIELIKPELHVFGHIHESYGMKQEGNTLHVNASLCDETYYMGNPPIVVDL